MGLVMAGLFTLTLALLALWVWSLRGSLRRDQTEKAAQKRQEQERQAWESREAQMQRPGIRLHCLGCGSAFTGPLPEEGCPQCHLSALVVPEEEVHGRQS
jgi:hypothetical protein